MLRETSIESNYPNSLNDVVVIVKINNCRSKTFGNRFEFNIELLDIRTFK